MFSDHLPHLSTFIEAADGESFTAAGRTLGITQAAVSQRIQSLEASLGRHLFVRDGGGVTLTPSGRRLYEYARRIIKLHSEARQVIAELKHAETGDLSIAASSIPGNHILPPSVAGYRRAFPNIRVRICVTDSVEVIKRVESGRADLGFTGANAASPDLDFQMFSNDVLALVVPSGHRLAGRRRVALRDFVREPFVQRESGSGSRHCFERELRRIGKSSSDLNIVLEVDGNEGVKEAVLQGLGVAVMSRRSVQQEVLTGSLTAIPVYGLKLRRSLYVVRDRRRPLTEPASIFLDRLGSAS
jgi:DNA-binding transcriptional LysR family regulator